MQQSAKFVQNQHGHIYIQKLIRMRALHTHKDKQCEFKFDLPLSRSRCWYASHSSALKLEKGGSWVEWGCNQSGYDDQINNTIFTNETVNIKLNTIAINTFSKRFNIINKCTSTQKVLKNLKDSVVCFKIYM